jgi:TonB-linked SusC/RagA family outer membrane protein
MENLSVGQQKSKKITGTVKDASGEPLIGVNVFVNGTRIGTVTDADGRFSLDVPVGKTIELSYVGYEPQYLNTDKASNFDVVLKDDSKALDEVVVVGFGTQKKVNLSGSVASVNLEKVAESRPITNLSSALAGTVTGLNVTSASNRPGSDDATLLVRGVGTLNNSSPLVIIDGSEGQLSDVNINDVESISVLKDASSSAIYGSRAANGVILVTTKKGKSGKVKVGYNGYVSFQSARKDLLEPVSNYADYMEYVNEGYSNSGVAVPYSTSIISEWRSDNGANPLKYPNVNWLDESFRTGVSNNHSLSIQGGNDVISTYTSIGYYNNPGIMENNGYKRYHLMSNIEANLAKWLLIGVNVNGYQGESEMGSGSFGWAYATSPAMILRYNGKYGGMQDSQADQSSSVNNMLASQNSTTGDNTTRNAKARAYFTLTPIKDLSITGSMVYEYNENRTKSIPVFYDFWNFANNTIILNNTGKTYISQSSNRTQRNYTDIVAKYGHRFLDERLGFSALVGASQEQYINEWENYQREDLIEGSLSVINAANGTVSASGNKSQWAMRSYFGRINLDWDNKYLLEFNLRSDGSSRFLSDNRWGWFPSFSLGWRISEEGFMKDINWIDNLKIRGSYGSLGNNSVGNYAARSTYSNKTYVVNGA